MEQDCCCLRPSPHGHSQWSETNASRAPAPRLDIFRMSGNRELGIGPLVMSAAVIHVSVGDNIGVTLFSIAWIFFFAASLVRLCCCCIALSSTIGSSARGSSIQLVIRRTVCRKYQIVKVGVAGRDTRLEITIRQLWALRISLLTVINTDSLMISRQRV